MMQALAQAEASAATHADPVDLVHLSRHTLGNRELEREVLRLFARQAEIAMRRIETATDRAVLRENVHTVNGSAKGVGAWKVADAADAAERALLDGEMPDLEPLRAAVEEAGFYIDGLLES
ncbi:Hpt domain-containing protein [Stappia stellulata]|uniref:Hpt domain-containing protein n=1 Tax=Stappia TaxID=152161 RepID=UPI001CD64FDB|nr:Hpt domain-containing protein [Stappia stellulata]MCA1242533.1 Hpt domain-containing protein [Stappia stellulata]